MGSRLFAIAAAAAWLAAACSVPSAGSADGVTWTCTDTPVSPDVPCHCQPSTVGAAAHIVDHCDASNVPDAAAGNVECCKQWIVLNGKRQTPFYCACYPSGASSCDTASGDEVLDRCP